MSDLPEVSALRDINEDAWTQLSAILLPEALKVAQAVLHGEFEEDAKDIANEAISVLQEKVHDVASSDDLPALLVTITRGKAKDFLRRQLSEKRGGGRVFRYGVVEDWLEADGLPNAAEAILPVDEAHFSSLAALLRRFSKALPPKVRELLIDRFYHDKSSVEIAEAHGMKEGAVRVALSRALDKLYEQLRGQAQLHQEIRELLALPEKLVSLLFAFL